MSWNYSGDPAANNRDAVRFLVQDTDTNRQLVTDEEIAWALTQEENIYTAAARVAELIGARAGNIASKTVGALSITYGAKHWQDLANGLRLRGATYMQPSAGGISISDKDVLSDDTDWPKPSFGVGMHDNK